MKNKTVIIDIICPSNGKTYDFSADEKLTVSQAAQIAAKQIMEFENNYDLFHDLSEVILFSQIYDGPLNPEYKLRDYNIKTGCSLMII